MSEPKPTFARPVLLTEAHDGSVFDCGETVLDGWLRERAWHNLQVHASRTYVVCLIGETRIVGYFALSMGQILARDVLGSMRRNIPTRIPAVIIGRLAIDRTCQGQGSGRAMLANAVTRSLRAATEVSARLVIVHALSASAEASYLRHGFKRLPGEQPTLALDLFKLQRIAGHD